LADDKEDKVKRQRLSKIPRLILWAKERARKERRGIQEVENK
jgi:hypothetical protein